MITCLLYFPKIKKLSEGKFRKAIYIQVLLLNFASKLAKMNLAVDIGNSTSVKCSLFEHDCLEWHAKLPGTSCRELEDILQRYAVDAMIVSSVGNSSEKWNDTLSDKKIPVLWLSNKTPLPIQIAYQTPQTLGSDRIAAAVGSKKMFPDSDLLVVDMGTCVTYDLLKADGTYMGGNIAPGMRLRWAVMHEKTARLPLIDGSQLEKWPELMGKNTQEALLGGVLWGMAAELEAYYTKLKKEYTNIRVVLTGGDAPLFKEHLDIEKIDNVAYLVEIGLNTILEFNIKNGYKEMDFHNCLCS